MIGKVGAERVPYVSFAGTVNMAGSQPFSMNNGEVRSLTERHGIPIYFDATRLVENAYFIQQREEGWRDRRWRRYS